ncbi:neuronal acetylcholine receptor subunit alpha-10-like [Lingula anatina]|uniref:Neuronal acetylcholine receptor subunit alpha-10-like n=1 Tax=Lingula anatina TaxID=7574 RepID=A0A1S3K700_LINAN|nr:neuronal acetylcholine receptor subunit alpha-10-like [Lingula anatina]|eukprot:XP_013418405.1 neuronal acetylcholine receptor subunit alpha-10-like [Lingula anatina]
MSASGTWSDSRLSWNESLYGHIEDIHVPITSIWRPDIILYNDVTEEQRTLDAYKAQVKSDGSVKWLAPALYQSYCKLDVQYFPKDLQVCPMKFGSWSFHGDHLNLVNMTEYGDVSNYVANGEWELVALPVVRHVVTYQCCSEAYPDVTFYFVMRRRSLYYMFNIMVPCIFIVSIALLTFYLPPESGEKVSLVVTVLLALTVFMLLVAEIMPPQADAIPLIAIYFGCAILLLCISTAMTVMVMNMQYSGAHGARAPPWLRRIVLGNLAKAMCLQRLVQQNLENWNPSEVQDKVVPAANGKIPKKDEEYMTTETPAQKFTSTASLCRTPQIRPLSAPSENKKGNNQDNDTLAKILRRLDGFEEHWKMKRRYDICKMEWELIVLVVDRMFLFLFFFMTFVINLIFLAYNPDTSDYSLDVQ